MLVVYIHGMNSTSISFNYIQSQLPNHNKLLIEYDSTQSLDKIIDGISKKLPKDEPIILIGHSLGGIISVILSSKFSNIDKIITIASPLGGSKAAKFMKYMMSNIKVLNDISYDSPYIDFIQNKFTPTAKIISLISINGHIAFPGAEQNDSVVSLSSQKNFKHSKQYTVNANHFEILQHPDTIKIVKKHLF